VGKLLVWGLLGAFWAVLAVVFDGRGQGGAALAAEIAAGLFGVFLFFSWLGARPRRR
jgi:hypothetical protein